MWKVAFEISDNSIQVSSSYAGPSVLFWVSSLVGIVLLPVLLERGMFFEQFWCKTEILSKNIFLQNSNQIPYVLSHKFTLLDYSKESIHGTWGTINYF